MEADAARRDDLVVQRLSKERVAEAIGDVGADDGLLFDHAGGRSLLERCLELLIGIRHHLAQDVQLELVPDDRGHAKDSICAVAQPRQSLAHRVAQPFGDPTGQTLIANPQQCAITPLPPVPKRPTTCGPSRRSAARRGNRVLKLLTDLIAAVIQPVFDGLIEC